MSDITERFWDKVEFTGFCWLWTAHINSGGYGTFRGRDRRMVKAHRFAYETLLGPIPNGQHLDHLCRVRRCVNPDHLEAVEPRVNTLRGMSPTAILARKVLCSRGHKLSGDNLAIVKGRRCCRECDRIRGAAYRERKRHVPPLDIPGACWTWDCRVEGSE